MAGVLALELLDASESLIVVGTLISGAKIRQLVGESKGAFVLGRLSQCSNSPLPDPTRPLL
jgi:hypothetical protein